MKYFYQKHRDNFLLWLAGCMPKRLVYWCAIKLGAYATTGKYESTIVPDMRFMDAIKRYGDDHLPG